MNLLALGVTFLVGAAVGAVTICTVQDAIVTWLQERAEQERKDKKRWLKREQETIGRLITRMK